MYRQTPCHQHLLMGAHAFDIIPKVYGKGPIPVVEPGVHLLQAASRWPGTPRTPRVTYTTLMVPMKAGFS